MVSQRAHSKAMFRCVGYEFEDVICAVDDVDMILSQVERPISERVLSRAMHTFRMSIRPNEPTMKLNGSISSDYDMAFVGCATLGEFRNIQQLFDYIRDSCRIAVCYVDEVWRTDLNDERRIKQLQKFDYVAVSLSDTCEGLSNLINRPVIYLPHGVDMHRFCPYPTAPRRAIDVYSMGRRSAETHGAILKWAEDNGATYLYDSVSGVVPVQDVMSHRNLIASLIKRCRYFIVNPAKINAPEANGQQEMGPRFFEGAGAGAVLLGQSPKCASFKKLFDWPDSVIEMPFGATDVSERLLELDSQPDRVACIRRNNIVNCLSRHDWVYRWTYLLDKVGMEALPAADERQKRLHKLANSNDRLLGISTS
jgi:Glycosyl transferases group 1